MLSTESTKRNVERQAEEGRKTMFVEVRGIEIHLTSINICKNTYDTQMFCKPEPRG